ncbi:Retrovirus-related Pol polyprotein from transposon TNT 1-94 [Symbiodinium microadriaticum]|uniref:Retrovirus-related Pol polyprotein from transposon TNT 1-94 n=1 Tax=Symbiodinium microadriaticum TaxID=2951 RepID=A0A1Q9D499_SYMMI|nr:Retrovirus-related Pol polyprotein from transposon TNT 1-94 [Symbiodinium microadriaticum]
MSQSKVCACLVKPDTIQPPRYAHCSHHMIEAFGNATGNTFHCSHCRLKCRECKGRVARVVKATGEIQYSHRKDCAVTPIPGPSAFSLLADGDLVQVEGAPETIDKGGLITYPFSVRRVAMLPSKLEQLKENDRRASEFSLETVNQKPAEQEIKTLKTSGALTGATSTGYPVGHPHPKVPQPAAAAASSSPELGAVMTAVREMLAKEYAAIPQKPDVTMSGESSIVAQIMELEGQAMELMTRAAHLRQQIGMPVNRFLAGPTAQATSQGSTPSSQWPGVSSTAVSDPDASDAWEVQVGDIEDTPGLELPQVELVEIFAGRARLSEEFESAGGSAIRLGRAWGQELQGEEARWYVRLPVNCQLIVTFFGDRPAPDAPIAAETQPVIKPVPGVQSVTDQRKVREYLQRLHVGLGHCGRAEFLQHLKDAGAATWLLRQAERFTCPLCEAQRAPDAHAVIGSARPRSFNSVVSIDTLDLTLERDSVQHRVFLLTAVDTATSFARVFHLAAGDSATAVQQLEQGWFLPYGAPEYIYCDPDTIFRSDQFGQCLARHSVVQRLSAAQAPYQHGQIERLHRTLRMQAQKVFLEERSCSPFDAATAVIQARNELMRVEGVSPSVLVFGKLPKAPPGLAEADEDYQLLAERLHREDPLYETLMLRRVAARTAWVQSEVRDRTARISATRPRPYKGPYYKGQVVLVYRRRKGDAANPGHKGVWLGPGEVVAVESTSDKLVPRVIYVTVHGRLFLCSPEQLRPVSVKAEWVRTQLQQSQSLQPTFQDMRMARGTDVRAERPTSAEWEAVHEVPDTHVSVEDLKEEADYEPLPQAPPTPVPGTPVPGTPAPGTPRPSVVAPPLVPLDLPTPAGGEAPADVGSLKRGDKRPHGEHADVELESQHRAELGPGAGSLLEGSPLQPSSSTVLRGDESRGSRARSRTPSRNPPARESSLWAFADFEGDAADHAAEAWYSESKEHDYSGLALGVEFDVDFEELENDESIRHIIKELCFDATAVHKRKAEINERYLTASEKQMFREAKRAEWSQWVANEVVELLSRRGVDPQRVISSRWVLTWKHVGDQPDGEKRAKARLVIRGFKDPDLGQYSTASPTLSRQGRHAILTIAAHHQYRLFTLDAKTAFLAGDRSSRVKPIYAELPRDLVQDQGYDEDTIARIKKVPYGLSEAPLAWYRRLTAELEACGFEQVPADRCIFVLRDKRDRSRVLGIVGAHVDDLLIAGCSAGVDSQFEEALQKLVARLPFGERKYADVAPVLYTGLNLRQHPLTKTITVDQAHYIEKLRETPLKPLKDGLLDKSGQTKFWSQLGALLWVAVNTRPDVAYDISHYASFGTRPEKRHIVALNKIVKTLQSQTCTLTFQKVAQRWEDLALVVFTDAGDGSTCWLLTAAVTVAQGAPLEQEPGERKQIWANVEVLRIRLVTQSPGRHLQVGIYRYGGGDMRLLLTFKVRMGPNSKARFPQQPPAQGAEAGRHAERV